jgi:hypothetical protein
MQLDRKLQKVKITIAGQVELIRKPMLKFHREWYSILLDLQKCLGHIRKVRKKISDTYEIIDVEANYRDGLVTSVGNMRDFLGEVAGCLAG